MSSPQGHRHSELLRSSLREFRWGEACTFLEHRLEIASRIEAAAFRYCIIAPAGMFFQQFLCLFHPQVCKPGVKKFPFGRL